jgi:hypothetical protein
VSEWAAAQQVAGLPNNSYSLTAPSLFLNSEQKLYLKKRHPQSRHTMGAVEMAGKTTAAGEARVRTITDEVEQAAEES